ncbi:hypothetical protein GCM10012279_08090 [Micromonospora yangpuensis]|nr:hypothetical protein GCM10012279_08090 [Micromonospora yangpuensis]
MASIATHTPELIMPAGAGETKGASIDIDADPVGSVSDTRSARISIGVAGRVAAATKAYALKIVCGS